MEDRLPVFIREVPDYEVVDGQMFIKLRGLDIVMPLNAFLSGAAKAERAIKEWENSRRGEVVQFQRSAYSQAASS